MIHIIGNQILWKPPNLNGFIKRSAWKFKPASSKSQPWLQIHRPATACLVFNKQIKGLHRFFSVTYWSVLNHFCKNTFRLMEWFHNSGILLLEGICNFHVVNHLVKPYTISLWYSLSLYNSNLNVTDSFKIRISRSWF